MMKWFTIFVLSLSPLLSITALVATPAFGVDKDSAIPVPKDPGTPGGTVAPPANAPAAPSSFEPGKAEEVVKGKALVHTIKLDEYLKNLKPDESVEKMDSQGKNNPDIFIIYKKNDDGTRQLVMQLFDINRDGKIDLVKHFEKGKLVKTEIDLDYDGYVDVVTEYDPATGEIKRKIQADGNTNIWKYYFKNELRKKEVDRNADGKPDMWVYYRNGKVIRTEVDKDFNGKIVRIDGPLNPVKDKKTKGGGPTPAQAD